MMARSDRFPLSDGTERVEIHASSADLKVTIAEVLVSANSYFRAPDKVGTLCRPEAAAHHPHRNRPFFPAKLCLILPFSP